MVRVFAILTLLLAGSLVACSASGGDSSTQAMVPTQAPTTDPAPSATPASVPTRQSSPTLSPTLMPSPEPSATTLPSSTPTQPPLPTTAPSRTLSATASPPATASPSATASPAPAPAPSDTPGEPEEVAGLVEIGLQVYRDQYCGLCHSLTAAGTAGIFGLGHDEMGAVASQRVADPGYTGDATSPAEYILESLINPQRYLVPGYEAASQPMPAYDFLTEAEIRALVEALRVQGIR